MKWFRLAKKAFLRGLSIKFTGTDLIEELFSCRIWLDGELQLRIHGGDSDIDLENKTRQITLKGSCLLIISWAFHINSKLLSNTVSTCSSPASTLKLVTEHPHRAPLHTLRLMFRQLMRSSMCALFALIKQHWGLSCFSTTSTYFPIHHLVLTLATAIGAPGGMAHLLGNSNHGSKWREEGEGPVHHDVSCNVKNHLQHYFNTKQWTEKWPSD